MVFPRPKALEEPPQRHRLAQDHVVILDGIMSSNAPGHETNAALLHRLLEEQAPKVKVYYRPGSNESIRALAGLFWLASI